MALSVTSLLNSLLHLLESTVYSRQIARVTIEQPPIFIIGHWRSGTTLLHTLLARDPQFTCPNLYQTCYPGHFLLTERVLPRLFRPLPKTRPMDNVPMAWDSPQEDETALLLMTLLSPYLAVAFPDDPARVDRMRNLSTGLTAQELDTWKKAFLQFLKKLTLKSNKRLVLKSPTHTGRIPLLLEMFPAAKFIHLVRDPYAVFSSTLHSRQSLGRVSGLNCLEPAGLEAAVIQDYLDLYNAYHLYRPLIPAENLHELRFEDLEADPLGEVRRIYERFKLSGKDELETRLHSDLQSHRAYRRNQYELSPEQMCRVYERWLPAFRRYGYPDRLPVGSQPQSFRSSGS